MSKLYGVLRFIIRNHPNAKPRRKHQTHGEKYTYAVH